MRLKVVHRCSKLKTFCIYASERFHISTSTDNRLRKFCFNSKCDYSTVTAQWSFFLGTKCKFVKYIFLLKISFFFIFEYSYRFIFLDKKVLMKIYF